MSDWRVAPAIKALFAQANMLAPGRDKSRDGTIGDQAHAARKSDHNPDAAGWVYAGDLTNDDAAGIDCRQIAHQIVMRKDRRVKYLIHEGRMVSSYPTGDYPAWVWRPYRGINGHFGHLHVSVLPGWRNDTSPWWTPATPDEEDVMTPEQEAKLDKVLAFLDALTAKRRPDKQDVDPNRLSLADLYTQDERKHS